MMQCMYQVLTVTLLLGFAALSAHALEGTVSSAFERIDRVFCLNSTTGCSLEGAVVPEADGSYRFDCMSLDGGANDAITILIQGTLLPESPPTP
ncbi:hypothetical protein C2W62_41550 [Candidatus Entotheonella serta]|nr:hypothetical protein C2W62_41550 [Candidatus Entotheonella serta]